MKFPLPFFFSLSVAALGIAIGSYILWTSWSAKRLTLTTPAPIISPQRRPASVPEVKEEQIVMVSLDEIVVNINAAKSKENHYLRMKLDLELFEERARNLVDQRQAGVKHTIIETLREQSYASLNTLDGKLYFKEHLVSELNKFLNLPAVRRVHFTSFYLQ